MEAAPHLTGSRMPSATRGPTVRKPLLGPSTSTPCCRH
jgi:hypothetical protein